jgi:hypothetical protein
VRPHQSFHFYTNTRTGFLKNNSRTLTKRLNFLWFLNLVFYCVSFIFNVYFHYSCIINFTITILFSLFLCSSLSFFLLCYNPLFSPQLLFLPLLIHSFYHLHLSLLSSPNLSPHYPSLLHTNTHWLAYCTKCTQPQSPETPDTSTLHYNNRNIFKHTQGPQNPAAHIPLPHLLTPYPTHPF